MSSYLAQLALHDSDRSRRRKSLYAVPSVRIRVANGGGEAAAEQLDHRVREKLGALTNECLYDWTVVMPNFDPRLGKVAPPTGYAASMHEDTTFCMDMIDRNLFRGVAFANLVPRGRFSDLEVAKALRHLNQVVRDLSPMPASLGCAANEWVCALGPNAWIGVFEKRQDGAVAYSLGVVAGLEDGVFHDMWAVLRSRYHGRASVKDAQAVLDEYRVLARENRARLLSLLESLLGEGVGAACSRGAPKLAYVREPCAEQSIPDVAWEWLPPQPFRVPIWYAFPRKSPRGCPDMPLGLASYQLGGKLTAEEASLRSERSPVALVPSMDVVLDDIKPYERAIRDHVVRYANCCADAHVAVRGPLDAIHVSPKAPASAATYRAFPAQAPRLPGGGGGRGGHAASQVPHTWEDPDLSSNVLADATYATPADSESGVAQEASVVSYYPVFVRISCSDELGLVAPPRPGDDRRRMSGFCGDAWEGL